MEKWFDSSQVLTQVQASNVGSSSDPKKGPEFARALAKKAGVYNKVKGLSVPEPKLNRLDKIAPNLQQWLWHTCCNNTRTRPGQVEQWAIGGFRPIGFWHKPSRCC